jgi:hypothetical protein
LPSLPSAILDEILEIHFKCKTEDEKVEVQLILIQTKTARPNFAILKLITGLQKEENEEEYMFIPAC